MRKERLKERERRGKNTRDVGTKKIDSHRRREGGKQPPTSARDETERKANFPSLHCQAIALCGHAQERERLGILRKRGEREKWCRKPEGFWHQFLICLRSSKHSFSLVCGQPLSLARPARSSRRLGKLKLVAEKRKKRKSGGRREKDRKKDISRDLLSSPNIRLRSQSNQQSHSCICTQFKSKFKISYSC